MQQMSPVLIECKSLPFKLNYKTFLFFCSFLFIYFNQLLRLAHSVRGMLAFGIYITHGIACYVAIELTWNSYVVDKISNERHKLIWEYVVRTIVVMITCNLLKCPHVKCNNILKNFIVKIVRFFP